MQEKKGSKDGSPICRQKDFAKATHFELVNVMYTLILAWKISINTFQSKDSKNGLLQDWLSWSKHLDFTEITRPH